MAKKLRPGADTADTPEPKKRGRPRQQALPTNVTDETVREFCDKAALAHGEFETAVGEMKQKQGVYRAVLKDAKKAGVDNDAIAWWLQARKREPGDIDRETRARNRVAQLMNLPIGTQLGLFEDGRTVATTIEDEQRDAAADDSKARDDAYFDGLEAGKAGKPLSAGGYAEGTKAYDEFERGWGEAQAARAMEMGKGGAHGHA